MKSALKGDTCCSERKPPGCWFRLEGQEGYIQEVLVETRHAERELASRGRVPGRGNSRAKAQSREKPSAFSPRFLRGVPLFYATGCPANRWHSTDACWSELIPGEREPGRTSSLEFFPRGGAALTRTPKLALRFKQLSLIT